MAKKRRRGAVAESQQAGPTQRDLSAARPLQGDAAPSGRALPQIGDEEIVPAAFRRTTQGSAAAVGPSASRPRQQTPHPDRVASGASRGPGVQITEELVEPQGLARRMQSAGGDAVPHGLAVTYVLDTSQWPAIGSVAIRFVGARQDGSGLPGDHFERVERLEELDPRTGRAALTARVENVNPGRWRIVATPVQNSTGIPLPTKAIVTSTTLAPLAQGPGVRVVAWPALVGLGAILAIAVQAVLVARSGTAIAPILGLSLVACVLGFLGGKVWFLVAKHRPPREFLASGAYIQGFLLGALAVLFLGSALLHRPPLGILDATAPGIFFGMAVGRPGCFLTGCCAGRPALSRWGLWSSDRRLAVRRVPVQLYEAGVALAIGVAALVLVLMGPPPIQGSIFAAAIAAYTFSRQFLFRLRADSHTRVGRLVAQAICASVLAAVVASFVLR